MCVPVASGRRGPKKSAVKKTVLHDADCVDGDSSDVGAVVMGTAT